MIDSKKSITGDENFNMVTELTIQQEKARRPESIDRIGLEIRYDEQ